MKDKELLLKAIDSYDLYTPAAKKVLKTLMDISINNIAIISVKKLTQLSTISRPIVYKALATLQKDNVIERMIQGTSKKSSFTIKYNRLSEIEQYYKLYLRKTLLNKEEN